MSKDEYNFEKYSEIEFDKELSFYLFKEYDKAGKVVETYENYSKDILKKLRDELIEKEKPKSSKKKRNENKQEVDAIENMMDSLIDTFENTANSENAESQLPEKASAIPAFNFGENRTKAEKQANTLLKSLLKFYLSESYISENDYIKAKIGIDQLTLSGIIGQMRIAEAAIEKMMESISDGETHPRMFEVLAGHQRVYIDLLKTQSLSIIATEEHVKKLKDDFDYYQGHTIDAAPETKKLSEDNSETTFRGTRDFLNEIDDEDDAEDIDFEDGDNSE